MKKFFIIVSILILLNVFFVYKMYKSQSKKIREVIDCTTPEKLYDNLESGDILLFRHKKANILPIYFFGDEFSHAAIVYKENGGIPYILEDGDFTVGDGIGTEMKFKPAYTRLQTYEGYVCIKKLNKPLNDDIMKKFKSLLDGYLSKSFSYQELNIVKKCILFIDVDYDKSYTYCSMFIAQVIRDLGLIELKTHELCMRPECFTKLYLHSKSKNGYYYKTDLQELKI